jgi:hypothetical protein
MQEYNGVKFLLEELEKKKGILLQKKRRLENMKECSNCYEICSPEEVKKIQGSSEWICTACEFKEWKKEIKK